MNINLIEDTKKYVKKLLFPLRKYPYHKYKHSLEVMYRAIEIAKLENISQEKLEILALASLFHDSWFIIQYDNNEHIWAKIAKNYLISILYPIEKIKLIEELILSTIIEYNKPKNILEKIIKDSDLDNLWTKDFIRQNNNLKKEIENNKNIIIDKLDWYKSSLNFIKNNNYYTNTQKNQRWDKKLKNILNLEKLIRYYNNTNK